jgi:hypothetical protein
LLIEALRLPCGASSSAPQVLVIHLKRFKRDMRGRTSKAR